MGYPDRARQARAALLWGAGVFALFQVALGVAMHRWLPQLRDPWYAYRAERLVRRTSGSARAFTVLVLGSSRVQCGLCSAELEARLVRQLERPVVVFNFGIPGAGPIANLVHYTRLRSRGIRPDLLLVEVLPVCLDQRLSEPPEADFFRAHHLDLRELDLLARYGLERRSRWRDWWLAALVPVAGQRFEILSRLTPGLLPGRLRLDWAARVDDSGWQPPLIGVPTSAQRLQGVARDREGHGRILSGFRLGEAPARALRDLVCCCREDDIPVALVWMPESSAYRGWFSPQGLSQLQAFLEQLKRERALPLIDARAWVRDDDFRDGHHLTTNGAAVFTERLEREVIAPTLSMKSRAEKGPPPT